MEIEEHREKLWNWLDCGIVLREGQKRELREALSAFSDTRLWTDEIDSVSLEQAVLLWRIIETVLLKGFPEELGI